MKRFVQLHYLTTYPPSNPNRDDQGRPKTAVYGGVQRLRISSQSLKRATRLSDVMRDELKGQIGERTRQIGDLVLVYLKSKGYDENAAIKTAKTVSGVFGKIDEEANKKDSSHIRTRQLAFISPDEKLAAFDLASKILDGEKFDEKEITKRILKPADGAVDIAMFGRMLADDPAFNREAAVQISHAITTHKAVTEDDYFTAVDDLKNPAEDSGAGFVGEAGFGSGVYYLYACVNLELLVHNLDGDNQLASRAVSSLSEALAISTPSGKRNSYGHQTRASYIRAEAGDAQPRSLASAFLEPVNGHNLMGSSIQRLEEYAEKFDNAYGSLYDSSEVLNIEKGIGSIREVKSFVSGQVANE